MTRRSLDSELLEVAPELLEVRRVVDQSSAVSSLLRWLYGHSDVLDADHDGRVAGRGCSLAVLDEVPPFAAMYVAIGESDRMTLEFMKPLVAATPASE